MCMCDTGKILLALCNISYTPELEEQFIKDIRLVSGDFIFRKLTFYLDFNCSTGQRRGCSSKSTSFTYRSAILMTK